MKLGALFSGGKDSLYAIFKAIKNNYQIGCLISIYSKNPDSYMFHTPSIDKVEIQSKVMEIPLIKYFSKGEKEKELKDLKRAILKAIEKYNIEGIITGAVESAYQASRVQKICNLLNIECFNPLWQKNQLEILEELVEQNFEVIVTSVSAYPLNEKWLNRTINYKFIKEIKKLNKRYKINIAGEGGEYETYVKNSPLFRRPIKTIKEKIYGEKNSWRMEIKTL